MEVMAVRPDERRLEVWRQFLVAHEAVLRTLEHELREERALPLGWYEVLLRLSRAEGGRLRMRELAKGILLTPSGLTRLADRMAEAGLIERVSCPTDRRGAFATITPAGKRRLRNAAGVHLRGVQEHFASLVDDEDVEVLSRVLSRMIEATET